MANNKDWLISISQFVLHSWYSNMSSMVDIFWWASTLIHKCSQTLRHKCALSNPIDQCTWPLCLRSSRHYYSRTWPAVCHQSLLRILYIFLPQISSSSTEGMVSSLLETFLSLNELFFHCWEFTSVLSLKENPECPWNVAAIHFSATSTHQLGLFIKISLDFSPHSAS